MGLADAKGDGQLIAFMRIGNESVPATPSQLRELVLRGSGESYDSLKSRYDFDNMSFTKLKSVYKQRTGNIFEDTDYESFGLIDEKGNLTNAGALLADESPIRLNILAARNRESGNLEIRVPVLGNRLFCA